MRKNRKILVGLGNPGEKYKQTRHNIGFITLDYFVEKYRIKENVEKKYCSLMIKTTLFDTVLLLIKPTTYMNNSGKSLKEIGILPEEYINLLVIHDDMDLELGRIKFKYGGSSGGHKGVQSIINVLGTEDFCRLRVGIGRDRKVLAEEYVLSPFKKDEMKIIEEKMEDILSGMEDWIKYNIDYVMNKYNRKRKEKKEEAMLKEVKDIAVL